MTEVSLIELTKNAHSNFQKLFLKTSQKSGDCGKKYGREDARREFFATEGQLNAWLLIQIEDFIGTIDKNVGKIERHYNFSENDRKTFLSNFDTINRASYLTKCMFDTEHFIKAILLKYNQPISNGFEKLTKNFLVILEKDNEENYTILNLPAKVRNSLHNDGFTNYDIDMTIDGKRYRAEKKGQVMFTGWDDLYCIVDKMIQLLINLVENSSMREKQFIPKLYSSPNWQ